MARGPRGLAVFTDGLPEYEAQGNGTIALTLLRAVGALSRGELLARPGHAAWATPVPAAQEPGDHEWHLGFLAVGEEALAQWTPVADAADEFDLPLAARTIRNALALSDSAGGVELEGEGLVATALHRAPGERAGVVLRCVNTLDRATRGVWHFAKPIAAAYRERLDGSRSYPLALTGGDAVEISAEPREIVTVRVT
jgi:alpha-mannosidase